MSRLQEILIELKEREIFKITFQLGIVYVVFYYTLFDFLGIQYITNTILGIAIYLYLTYWLATKLHFRIRNLVYNGFKSRPVSNEDLERTAYHEAGHALIARLVPTAIRIKSISIVPNKIEHYLGIVKTEGKHSHITYSDMLNSVKISFAGMVSENIAFNEHSIGCRSDLQKAKNCVYDMLQNFNMGQKFIYSNRKELDDEVERILQEEKNKTRQLLTAYWNILFYLKDELLLKQKMNEEEIDTFFKKYGI